LNYQFIASGVILPLSRGELVTTSYYKQLQKVLYIYLPSATNPYNTLYICHIDGDRYLILSATTSAIYHSLIDIILKRLLYMQVTDGRYNGR